VYINRIMFFSHSKTSSNDSPCQLLMTSHSTSNFLKHEQPNTTKMSNCVFVFEAFHLCGHRKVTERHAESCPRKGFKVLGEEGPQCDDHRREFHYHQAKCDLCMVDAGNPDMVARDIRGLYLSENEIGEIRKGATFQTHKEFCKAEAELEDKRVEPTPEQTLCRSTITKVMEATVVPGQARTTRPREEEWRRQGNSCKILQS
jgi:hypothetical protein